MRNTFTSKLDQESCKFVLNHISHGFMKYCYHLRICVVFLVWVIRGISKFNAMAMNVWYSFMEQKKSSFEQFWLNTLKFDGNVLTLSLPNLAPTIVQLSTSTKWKTFYFELKWTKRLRDRYFIFVVVSESKNVGNYFYCWPTSG